MNIPVTFSEDTTRISAAFGDVLGIDNPEAIAAAIEEHNADTAAHSDLLSGYATMIDHLNSNMPSLTPDMFDGTDGEKIQACMDALSGVGGIITINKNYTLDRNIIVTHPSGKNNLIIITGNGQENGIFCGDYSFIGDPDTGVSDYGGIMFKNLRLQGTGTLCDCTHMLRLFFESCSFSQFEHIIHSADSYIQSAKFSNCMIRNIQGYALKAAGMYDVAISNSLIEWCFGLIHTTFADSVFITNSCIEGFANLGEYGVPIVITEDALRVRIDGNYFERNGGLLDISSIPVTGRYNISVTNNKFSESIYVDGELVNSYLVLLPPAACEGTDIKDGTSMFFGFNWCSQNAKMFKADDATTGYGNIACIGNSVRDATSDIIRNCKMEELINQTQPNIGSVITIHGTFIGVGLGKSLLHIPIQIGARIELIKYSVEIKNIQIVNIGTIDLTNASVVNQRMNTFTIADKTTGQYEDGKIYVCHVYADVTVTA